MPASSAKAQAWLRSQEDADRKNARVVDKVLLALPRELGAEQRAKLVRTFAEAVTRGRASWLAAFHEKGKDQQNPHCHLVVRDRDPETGKRVCEMSERGSTDRLRLLWEQHANRALEMAGRAERIDRRTLAAQGVRRRASIHEGLSAREMTSGGKEIRSRPRRYRNGIGARSHDRTVDYRRVDQGRSRPAHNEYLRETEADYWAALDRDRIVRQWRAEDRDKPRVETPRERLSFSQRLARSRDAERADPGFAARQRTETLSRWRRERDRDRERE